MTPARGDLVWLEFSPTAGHEQSGRRPAVVISPRAYNERVGLAIVCPVISRAKGYPFEVALPPGLPIDGVILADQVKNVDWRAHRAEVMGAVPNAVVREVIGKLGLLLGP